MLTHHVPTVSIILCTQINALLQGFEIIHYTVYTYNYHYEGLDDAEILCDLIPIILPVQQDVDSRTTLEIIVLFIYLIVVVTSC